MRIGIVGGTFDPFHRGHLEAPLRALHVMGWSKLLFVPARRQPFKQHNDVSSEFHRLAMTLLAIQDVGKTEICYAELERNEVSYAVDTLGVLRRKHPGAVFDWVIGDDNVGQLLSWRSLDEIFRQANFVVLTRRGNCELPESLQDRRRKPSSAIDTGGIVFVDNDAVAISSTEIRDRVRRNESIERMVDPRVAEYIERYRLYKNEEK